MVEVKTGLEIRCETNPLHIQSVIEERRKWVSLHDLKNLIKKYRMYNPSIFDAFEEEICEEE